MSNSLKVIQSLIHNDNYTRKVLPFLKEEYFRDDAENILFKEVRTFVDKYNAMPTLEALTLILNEKSNIPEQVFKNIGEKLNYLKNKPQEDTNWLVDFTEKFCKQQALDNAIIQVIDIREGKDKKHTPDAIPGILQQALGVTFDSKVGHDYFENYVERFEYYNRKEIKVPFDVVVLNEATKGGVSNKTLTILIAGPNVGKTATMCHMAAANLMQGKNVLYVTGEMSEEEISRRIDANLLDVTADRLETLPIDYFGKKIESLRKATQGTLIVKEYATATAHAGTIQTLLHELNLKKNFVPHIIYIDYMNIFLSSRMKAVGSDKSYGVVKSISEEFRGLAVTNNIPVVTATQFNRTGHGNSDPDEGDIADSFGPIMTADLVWALVRNDQLAKAGQMMIKQLKSRYMDKHKMPKFFVGFQPDKGRLVDVEQPSANGGVTVEEDNPVFDSTETAISIIRENSKPSKSRFKFNFHND